MGIDQWEWEGMGILIVFPHISTSDIPISGGQITTMIHHAVLQTDSTQ